jgi:GTP cyclohydrolase IB
MRSLTDTQNEKDDRNLPIDRVGVKNLRIPIQAPQQAGGLQNTIATVALSVDLPAELKGTHMSRFVEVLNTHGTILDLPALEALPQELLTRLQATRAYISYQFPFFLKKLAPVSNGESWMDYEVRFEINASQASATEFTLTVLVPVATLCPCSKAISERGAHNQRGLVTFSVRSREAIAIEELIALVERSASCELYSLLKRVDEKYVTEKAYDNPVFVEDLVRNVASQSREIKSISWFRVEAENFESIHNHNAYAIIESHQP